MKVSYATTKGVKPRNEDSILIGSKVLNDGLDECLDKVTIFGVADGVSSTMGGDIASRIILEELSKLNNVDVTKPMIDDAIANAKNKMFEIISNNNNYKNMATTLSCVIISNGIKVFNLGDSPIFIYKFGALRKISNENTLFNDMLVAGLIDENDKTVNRHVITKYIDAFHSFPFELKENIRINTDDYVLISSDGLTESLDENIIENVLASEATLKEKVEGLLKLSLARGTKDNVSIILIQL
jgi:protein phosphatase